MKILLINPLVREWAQPNCFPSGLGYIATVLLQEGHDVVVMDFGQRLVITGKVQHEGVVDRASNGRRIGGNSRW